MSVKNCTVRLTSSEKFLIENLRNLSQKSLDALLSSILVEQIKINDFVKSLPDSAIHARETWTDTCKDLGHVYSSILSCYGPISD